MFVDGSVLHLQLSGNMGNCLPRKFPTPVTGIQKILFEHQWWYYAEDEELKQFSKEEVQGS